MWEKITWFFDELGTFFNDIWNDFLLSIVDVIDLIPLPDFMLTFQAYSIPSDVSFFVSALELPTGFGIIAGASIVRFLIRRIPIIG